MAITRRKRRVILDAAIDRSVIRGTLTGPTGERRDFHGWLELSTALETILDPGGDHERNSPATSGDISNSRFEEEGR
jgi:hypothetical protein